MISLALSILSSSLIYVVFKLLGKFEVYRLHALIFNYLTAFLLGLSMQSNLSLSSFSEVYAQDWFFGAIFLGILFITIFNFMVITTQKSGLSVVSVASKMSLAIPVIFVIIAYDEALNLGKLTGIILALVSVFLVSIKSKSLKIDYRNLIFPLIVFVGSGIIESSIKFFENDYVAKSDVAIFSASIFLFAFISGLIMLFSNRIHRQQKLLPKAVLGGICLGIPNYFSIYFFIKALGYEELSDSGIFIINNVSIVLLSTIIGILAFHERLILKNWIGIATAIVSLVLISLFN
ncbi:MAG: EamA/RhaT family transporter [Psychroflexus salarius]